MQVTKGVTCPFCGVTCDDLEIHVEDGQIREVKNACSLGRDTFLHHLKGLATPRIDGKAATVDACIEAAAEILARAKYPLIYGLDSTELHAQRKAIELADLIGANIDHTSSICHAPSLQAVQTVGLPTCTMGEVKNRADLVIFWGCNPAEAHPRHATRFSVTPKGMFTPQGRKDRTIIHVDVRKTPSTRMADAFIQIKPHSDYEIFSVLTALVKGHDLDVAEVGGVPMEEWRRLVALMKDADYGILHWGMGLTMTRGRHFNSGAVLALATDLNEFTHFVAKPVRGHGNVTGADNVVSWSTGFPFGINFGRGYPRFNPGEFTTVDLLSRGEADAALIIASDPAANFPKPAVEHLKRIPVIVLDPKASVTGQIAKVAFTTATYGINTGGTVYRMDDVAIALRPAFESPYPSDEEVLTAIKNRVRELLAGSGRAGAPAAQKVA